MRELDRLFLTRDSIYAVTSVIFITIYVRDARGAECCLVDGDDMLDNARLDARIEDHLDFWTNLRDHLQAERAAAQRLHDSADYRAQLRADYAHAIGADRLR